MSDTKFSILFVCTGNTCRSPMAEYAMRSLLEKVRQGKVRVVSAGIAAAKGHPATRYAIEAAKMWSLDMTEHQSQQLTSDLISDSDLIFAMSPEHLRYINRHGSQATGKAYLLKNFPDDSPIGEAVEDPIGQELEVYNEVFLDIGEQLGKHMEIIIKLMDEKAHA